MRRPKMKTVLLVFLLFTHSTARDTVTPTSPLANSETLVSTGGKFILGFFSPPNSKNHYIGVWFNNVSVQTIVWVANRDNPVTDSGGSLSISNKGSLIITDENSTLNWSSAASRGMRNPVAQLLDTGNFVVREANNADPTSYAWQSFNYPTDTLLPGMKLGVDRKRGLNMNLTSWKSPSDPSTGEYCNAMDIQGDPEILILRGSQQRWRTGPWNGMEFDGVPDSDSRNHRGLTMYFINNKDEVTYSYEVSDPAIITRLVLSDTGLMQRYLWMEASESWNVAWYAPNDQCDTIYKCGPYGVCNQNVLPFCACLEGFTPKSPANWALRDDSDGCMRKTALDCRNGTDGFTTVNGAKLPDTSSATLNVSMSLADCRAACLNNCSCTAYAAANVTGSENGCVIWTTELTDLRVYSIGGQDLHVRLAAADLGPTQTQSHKTVHVVVAIGICIALAALLVVCAGCFTWRRKKTGKAFLCTTSFTNSENSGGARENDLELPLFDFPTIAIATDNFSMANKLGEGGFGPVYKGKLGENQDIAVKRLAKTSIQGFDEFKNEVTLIAKLQHRNLVRLLGCCIQGEERMLMYEYMPNQSLDTFLFDKTRGTLLDWQTRHKIIEGIARGLLYLHQDSRLRIIHRDLKASNILLDKEMNPKISDFGMARMFGGDEIQAQTRRVVGTYGYMSPEYAMDGIFSIKSDVFSFGVLVLEIISGKKNRGVYLSSPHLNLLGHVWSLWNEGNSFQIVDKSIGDSFPRNEVLRCIKLGLLCVQECPEDRPLISSILLMLGSDIASLPHPKVPGFVARKIPFKTNLSSSKEEAVTINDITISMFNGR